MTCPIQRSLTIIIKGAVRIKLLSQFVKDTLIRYWVQSADPIRNVDSEVAILDSDIHFVV